MPGARIIAIVAAVAWLVGHAAPVASQPTLPPDGAAAVDPIPNRYLAFGDSITYGHVGMTAYPIRLEAKLDLRVAPSEVINAGQPGEGCAGGRDRIAATVQTQQPSYILILEGANDVTRGKEPPGVLENLSGMIDNARSAGVNGVQILLATLIPRRDELLDETYTMNQEAVWPAAEAKGVPVCDLWTVFSTQPNWWTLYYDDVHPNDAGFQLMADAFYDCLLASFPEIHEDDGPPAAWIEPLPPESECGQAAVAWNGSDDVTWVVDYDVQAQVGDGPWTDWIMATTEHGGVFTGGRYGDRLGFRARGRDLAGNQGEYGEPGYTLVADSVPPYEAHIGPLPVVQAPPFEVKWWGRDACADVTAYDVQYRAGAGGAWQDWLPATPERGGTFGPAGAQYGSTYYFRVRAQDAAQNWGAWSEAEAWTQLARFWVGGRVTNVRHEPVAGASAAITPAPLWLGPQAGGFLAYVVEPGDYDICVARDDLYGALPPMLHVPVNGSVSGMGFVLPPQDDAVADGGFEAEDLAAWQVGGTLTPTLVSTAHTGLGAVRLGGAGGRSHLAQSVSPPMGATEPTLSFMVRLEQPGPAAALAIEVLSGEAPTMPVTYTLALENDGWRHAWYDVSEWAGLPLTVTLVVSDSPAILVDEISLGSAVRGGYRAYVPVVSRRR